MFAVIGLGNPGRRYAGTRHNVGFDTIDCLAQKHDVKISKIKHRAVYGEVRIGREKVLLVKPQTFMNNSGESVLDIYKYYDIPIQNFIVVYDDIDIQVGTLRVRKKGSAGTHNGMRSIIYQLQDDAFPRVRIGVGRPTHGDLVDYVLGRFNKEDRALVDEVIEKSASAIEEIIMTGVDKAMNLYNG